jgi:hypothetical protein
MQKKLVIKRILYSMLAGLLFGLVFSEVTFLLLGQTAREPKIIQITVPAGTAELVARGEQPPSIPKGMTFVVGDTLEVINLDKVDHQIGPLWIPPGASASLTLGNPENLAYECSFQAGNYIGLDVRQPLTLFTRIYGILFAGIPMGILLSIYIVILPSKKKNDTPKENVQP